MIIKLAEISEEGESFSLSRQSGELNTTLNDLIGENDYNIEFTINPLDQGFDLSGSVKTQTPELCSRCGIDIKIKINKSFRELLLPRLKTPEQGDHYSRVNHYTDLHEENSPSVIECENLLFDVGEFFHELIGLQIPLKPVGETDDKGDCLVCGLNVETTNFGYDEAVPAQKNNPFGVLKNIKLN
ncbi:MAG: hypothetical protein RJB66_504 [Pseudomonadota bacterium]